MKLKRKYINYNLWEDFHNGLYEKHTPTNKDIKNCYELLSNRKHTYEAMKRVVKDWKLCSSHNLTNYEINRRAWLGQAACCLRFKCNQEAVILAWRKLPIALQQDANNMANLIIKEYENNIKNELCLKLNLE